MNITVPSADAALHLALEHIEKWGTHRTSRGKVTKEVRGPSITTYTHPRHRVVFSPVRNANPFFHLIDAIWLLSGSNRVELPCAFLPSLAQYSDNGLTFHGAYGHRLRHLFGFDQIEATVQLLRDKPDTRQAVMSIWHPMHDLNVATKDVPCNDMLMFNLRNGQLDMTVCCRSNDAVWGAYGANVVQFSVLLEYMAALVGARMGQYVQMSNSLHFYEDTPAVDNLREGHYRVYPQSGYHSAVMMTRVTAKPMFAGIEFIDTAENRWGEELVVDAAAAARDAELLAQDALRLAEAAQDYSASGGVYSQASAIMSLSEEELQSTFGRGTLTPMIKAYAYHHARETSVALQFARLIQSPDWRLACIEWLLRAQRARDAKSI
jgi:thymidylate synthase